ncbi:MAG: hypothetical protein RB289_08830 [Paludibacter sp.]|jgi:hypothetical protein|nr:hypothetical protein [Paludibacter sp.]MDX9920063.1 hypothetical protein [Paludibacter sp.]
MQTSFHFRSAQDITTEMLDKIKSTYKAKPVTIIVEEDNSTDYKLSDEQKHILDQRLEEDIAEYLTSTESLERLKRKNEL